MTIGLGVVSGCIRRLCFLIAGVRSVFYNGFTAADLMAAGPDGVAVLGQEHVDPFITRGILLDVLGVKLSQNDMSALGEPVNGNPVLANSYRITVEDLQDAMAFGGIIEFVFFYTPQRGKGATASNTAPAALGQPNFRGKP